MTAARTAAEETEAARPSQRQAEQAAEEKLTAVEDIELERDRARADLTRIAEELEYTKSLLCERDGQLAQARHEADAVRAEALQLQMQLTAPRPM